MADIQSLRGSIVCVAFRKPLPVQFEGNDYLVGSVIGTCGGGFHPGSMSVNKVTLVRGSDGADLSAIFAGKSFTFNTRFIATIVSS